MIAGRLEGRSTLIMQVRVCDETRQITTDWKATDHHRNVDYAIRDITEDPSRAILKLLAESGEQPKLRCCFAGNGRTMNPAVLALQDA